ncbi:MAG: hypothetical protein AB7T06_29125 [Kofleriaceae bacterium]
MIRLSALASLSLPALLSLVGCTTLGERAESGECPAGEVCSDLTPYGLHFIGNPMADEFFLSGPSATAIGGTQEIELEYERANGLRYSLDLPWEADDDGALGVRVLEQEGSIVTVGGQRSRKNYLRIINPNSGELYDRYEIAGAAISDIRLIGTEAEVVPQGADLVWAPGDQKIGIALFGEVQNGSDPEIQRIVDSSMGLSLAGSERTHWDELRLANATIGVHALTVEAGDIAPRTFDLEIVGSADSITVIGGAVPTVQPNSSTQICFQARNAGRYIYGLTWQFNVDGEASTGGKDAAMRNCVRVEAELGQSGTIPVAAAAGGQQINVDVEISSTAARLASTGEANVPASAVLTRDVPTAGDRARM